MSTRAAWRSWLAEHHDSSNGVWLVYAKKGTGVPTLTYEESVLEALCFGWIDGLLRSVDDTFYKRRFTPRKPRSSWSPSNKRRVAQLESEGLMTPAGQALVDAAKAGGSWAAADRPAVPDRPTADFQEALDRTPAAKAGFEALTPARKRQYIGWIATARRPETRAKRIEESLALLREGRPLGMV
ncbi:MAG: YdeI/OmpD-associated family protein [Gemmatimonadales bacterium]|nr:MAG: YdeI/OmpD-associated family protein [Gemmatimonadales bacterium]